MIIALAVFVVALAMFLCREHVQVMLDNARAKEAADELEIVHECCCKKAVDI